MIDLSSFRKMLDAVPDLSHYHTHYVQHMLEDERGDLTELEADVLRRLKAHELLTVNLNPEFDEELTLG